MAHPMTVCSVEKLPVAGYDPKHFFTYLAAQHETEIGSHLSGGTRHSSHTGCLFQRRWALAFWRQKVCVYPS